MSENRRRFFRVNYPTAAGPKLVSNGVVLTVINISEMGIRFEQHKHLRIKEGESFAGSLSFSNGESFLVFGTVKRVINDGVGVELRKPIPLRIIMSEQRRLIQQFPKRA